MKREPTAAFAIKAKSAFRDMVLDNQFPSLGDSEKSYGFGVFDAMATKEATRELSYQLFDFAHSAKKKTKPFSSFVAVFHRPLQLTQREFEACLWLQLWQLHRFDSSEWDATASADPAEPHFSFRFGGQRFYVIGMHAHSLHAAHRFRWPTLVFNPHQPFQRSQVGSVAHLAEMSIHAKPIACENL